MKVRIISAAVEEAVSHKSPNRCVPFFLGKQTTIYDSISEKLIPTITKYEPVQCTQFLGWFT